MVSLRGGDQRTVRHDGCSWSHRPRDTREGRADPAGDGPGLVPDRGHPASGDLQLLGGQLHPLRVRDGADGVRRAQEVPGLGEPWVHGEAVLPGIGEIPGRVRGAGIPGRADLQPSGARQRREVPQGSEAEGGEEWEIGHARHSGILCTRIGHRCWPLSKPA